MLAEPVVERAKGGKGLSPPRSPQPSHAHACPPAVNSTLLTTGSHLAPAASAPTPSLGKTSPEVPSPARAFWGGEGGEDPRALGCKRPADAGTRGKREGCRRDPSSVHP